MKSLKLIKTVLSQKNSPIINTPIEKISIVPSTNKIMTQTRKITEQGITPEQLQQHLKQTATQETQSFEKKVVNTTSTNLETRLTATEMEITNLKTASTENLLKQATLDDSFHDKLQTAQNLIDTQQLQINQLHTTSAFLQKTTATLGSLVVGLTGLGIYAWNNLSKQISELEEQVQVEEAAKSFVAKIAK